MTAAALALITALTVAPRADGPLVEHVRTVDPRIRAAITDGLDRSALFRDLVSALDSSDVIVYIQCDPALPGQLLGRLTFMSAAAGQRYVMVGIARGLSGDERIATLGHELQHAVEIARAQSVTDIGSLAAEYRRIGFGSTVVRRGFDSQAAIDVGHRVWRELTARGE